MAIEFTKREIVKFPGSKPPQIPVIGYCHKSCDTQTQIIDRLDYIKSALYAILTPHNAPQDIQLGIIICWTQKSKQQSSIIDLYGFQNFPANYTSNKSWQPNHHWHFKEFNRITKTPPEGTNLAQKVFQIEQKIQQEMGKYSLERLPSERDSVTRLFYRLMQQEYDTQNITKFHSTFKL